MSQIIIFVLFLNDFIMNKKPESLTFDRFQELLAPIREGRPNDIFISKPLTVVGNVSTLLRQVIASQRLMQLEDYRIGMIMSGTARANINLIEHELKANTLVFLTPGTIVEPIFVGPDFTLKGMAMSAETLHLAAENQLPGFLNGEQMDGQINVTEAQKDFVDHLFSLLLKALQQQQTSIKVVHALLMAVLHDFDDLFMRQRSVNNRNKTRDRRVFEQFIHLVNLHSKQEHQLPFYANKLCLTERYLGTIIKNVSGITAKKWIDRSIMAAAQVMLKYSDLSVSEIAMQLNFPDPSFFNKFFKRHKGYTPMDFRRQ